MFFIIGSMITTGYFFFLFMNLTDHIMQWNLYLRKSAVSIGSLKINEHAVSGGLPGRYSNYLFTEILYVFGKPGLVLFGVLLVTFSVAIICSLVKLYKTSKKRAAFGLGIYMLIVGIMLYSAVANWHYFPYPLFSYVLRKRSCFISPILQSIGDKKRTETEDSVI